MDVLVLVLFVLDVVSVHLVNILGMLQTYKLHCLIVLDCISVSNCVALTVGGVIYSLLSGR